MSKRGSQRPAGAARVRRAMGLGTAMMVVSAGTIGVAAAGERGAGGSDSRVPVIDPAAGRAVGQERLDDALINGALVGSAEFRRRVEDTRRSAEQIQRDIRTRKKRLGFAPRGSFSNVCQVSHRNTDNFIVSPDVIDGAQHLHDYYGNTTTNAFSTLGSLQRARSTCANERDHSAYWVPVLLRDNRVVEPESAQMIMRGYNRDVGAVVSMPRGLRMITGNAKQTRAEGSNAQFACSGSEKRRSKTFPNCPTGSRLIRIQDFPSCWDGRNLDSADHRSHVVFTAANGQCPKSNPVPLPRLSFRFVYPVSGNPARLSLGSFPEAGGLSFSDHADAFNLNDGTQMRQRVADCINSARACGLDG
jgi:hypothetical protein